ncbi:sugar phosphate isomerase/epimerase [Paenibacillus sp. N4]|uniref:sugar phosphate isomerase/epimerase family protein n=1 Tax=Paenibacillus vietnamensis TaxID=2590547 RepID=UPI001CD14885|nr:sugar phosphate isomerase/epimerase [Paenibacillus vietnamensis]MCA0758137.1 sugar phosphate isomerase/epimerase [Paenibacillus vietnamensis]
MAKPVIGIQMYSLRDQTEIDFLGTLKKAAEMGYKAAEFTGFFKTPSCELKSKLEELKLEAASAHVPLNFSDTKHMESDFAGQIAFAKEIGISYIVTPWAPLPVKPTMDDVKYLTGVLTKCGRQVNDAGLQYSYHTHDFEFKLVAKKPVIEHLLERVPADLMTVQFDLGWLFLAGYDPLEYLDKYKGRVPLVHFNDFRKGRMDVEIGKGEVGYERILEALEPAGVKYVFTEQEAFEESSLKSAENNLRFFKERGY